MRLKKNIFILVLMLAFTFVLTACSTGPSGNSSISDSSAAAENSITSSVPSDSEQTDGTVLVAYFSHTGNTEEVAGQIADLTGGTLAEIQRAEKYGNLQEEAEVEILEGVYPGITVSVDNIENYNTIFVGYPICWNEAPAMIATFLDSYDFSGKTIIPFLYQCQRYD